ncbi:MAG: hypothetical protein IIU68_03985 [Bacteroidales bacterium]|nr:hypothetical protein [Bacteroidales bacterium]MBQ5582495.1 hypothetical protein [Bacteroidales bacterium]
MTAFLVSAVFNDAHAQFREQPFQQQYNDNPSAQTDTVESMFSLKEYIGGLQHKNTLKIGTMAAGSAVLVGGCQIYNKQYWKLPIVYGTIGGSLGAGLVLKNKGNDKAATWCFVGAGVAYWATMLDGVINFEKDAPYPHPGRATMYSLLVPGLGQIYNKEYWKVPIYVGGIVAATHYYTDFKRNFERFRNIYLEATNPDIQYTGPIPADQALYYRDVYRRYRDYSLLAIAAVYLLQVIDANVFSYMHDFEVTDDLALSIGPSVINPPTIQMASSNSVTPFSGGSAVGLSLGFSF